MCVDIGWLLVCEHMHLIESGNVYRHWLVAGI